MYLEHTIKERCNADFDPSAFLRAFLEHTIKERCNAEVPITHLQILFLEHTIKERCNAEVPITHLQILFLEHTIKERCNAEAPTNSSTIVVLEHTIKERCNADLWLPISYVIRTCRKTPRPKTAQTCSVSACNRHFFAVYRHASQPSGRSSRPSAAHPRLPFG